MAIFLWSIFTSVGAVSGKIYGVFIISRIVVGVGQGILFPVASKIIQDFFPFEERSRANAIYQSGGILASFLAPLLLVPLIMIASWQFSFHLIAIVGLLLLFLCGYTFRIHLNSKARIVWRKTQIFLVSGKMALGV